jgi:hypothetical protein
MPFTISHRPWLRLFGCRRNVRDLRTSARCGLPDDRSNARETCKSCPVGELGNPLCFTSGWPLRRRVRLPNLPAGACRDSGLATQSRLGDARQCPPLPWSSRPTPPRRDANAAPARSAARSTRCPNSPSRPEFGASIAHPEGAARFTRLLQTSAGSFSAFG